MIAKPVLLAAALLLSAAEMGWAQSATGGNFGTLPSGSAAWRSNGGGSSSRHRDAQSVRGGSSGREIAARDAERSAPIAQQASTPQH